MGLEWAPPGLELCLLATTASGEILLWRHGALNVFVSSPLSLKDWQLDHVRQLPSSPGRRSYQPYNQSSIADSVSHQAVPYQALGAGWHMR